MEETLNADQIRCLWQEASKKIICSNLEDKIRRLIKNKPPNYLRAVLHSEWRLGYNYYMCNRYFDAIKLLEKCCSGGEEGAVRREKGIDILHRKSDVHLITGRCCVQLYYSTGFHYYLESAYGHYRDAIETIHVLSSILELPSILVEFATFMEHYGAFESALDVYSQILSLYSTYKGYFNALYRSAIVGKHVSDICEQLAQKEETLNKCLDVLAFLLEALPLSINEVHITFLYARCLECSSDSMIRYRSKSIYRQFFDLCRNAQPAAIAEAAIYPTFDEWFNDDHTWQRLADYFTVGKEPLLAKETLEVYIKRAEKKRTFGQEIADVFDVPACIQIAKCYASFQSYETAVKYAEYAFQKDHVNKEVRALLARCSAIYKASLEKEDRALVAISVGWRGRCWAGDYRRKLKSLIVEENEQKLQENLCDLEARSQLAYYARDKWRARFLFEDVCARRIQRLFRSRSYIAFWFAPLKLSYLSRASKALAVFNRTPYTTAIRDEIRAITDHRFCPKHHAITRVRTLMDRQDDCTDAIRRAYRAYRIRRGIKESILQRQDVIRRALDRAAMKIQCMIRGRLAVLERKARHRLWKRQLHAVMILQRVIRWRNMTFRHNVTRLQHRRVVEISRARAILSSSFAVRVKEYLRRKRDAQRRVRLRELVEEERRKVKARQLLVFTSANKIKRFIRKKVLGENVMQMAFLWSQIRRQNVYSKLSKAFLQTTTSTTVYGKGPRGGGNERGGGGRGGREGDTVKHVHVEVNDDVAYRIPGIRQHAPQYIACLQQNTIFCSSSISTLTLTLSVSSLTSFTAADCMMLSSVLKNPACNVRHLILYCIDDSANPSYEFDLVPAIAKCRSLRSVRVYGGEYSSGFLTSLLEAVQLENPRIVEVFIESVKTIKVCSTAVAVAAGKLICDYFNYSVPGLVTLSLHNCYLNDEDLTLIATGLEVNSSLKHLVLSGNLVTDDGFYRLFTAVSGNRKHSLLEINASGNLLMLKAPLRQLFAAYVSSSTTILAVVVLNNMIRQPYLTQISRRRRVELTVQCFSHDDLLPGERKAAVVVPSSSSSPDNIKTATAAVSNSYSLDSGGGNGGGNGTGGNTRHNSLDSFNPITTMSMSASMPRMGGGKSKAVSTSGAANSAPATASVIAPYKMTTRKFLLGGGYNNSGVGTATTLSQSGSSHIAPGKITKSQR